MSDRTMNERPREFGVRRKTVRVLILPQGAGGDPQWRSNGGVADVTRSAAGDYLVTLEDAYHKLVGYDLSTQVSTLATEAHAKLGPVANVGTTTPVTAHVYVVDDASGAVDLAADANHSVSVALHFEDSKAAGAETDHV